MIRRDAPFEEDTVTAQQTVDSEQIGEFLGRLTSIYSGSMLSYMIDIGDRTGLFDAAARGPATSEELAARAGLTERYVREWLGAVVAGQIFEYDPETRRYSLPPARLACLTAGPANLAPISRLNTLLGKHVHQVARAFREGGGVPYAEFRPEFTDVMDAIGRGAYDAFLLDAYLPLVPGLVEKLESGARVADVACGTGHALVVLARAFPASTFTGYDLDDGAIARARAEADGAGLGNIAFETRDAARLTVREPFDAVFVFDAIHDQVDPASVLARIHDSLEPGGFFFMKEPHAADTLEENALNPMGAVQYALSTLHCMTVSLAHDGAGIGTAFGEGMARRMLAEAGFVDVQVHPSPADPMNAIYVSRKPSASE
jgi:SAM-dependent methyltransferase